MSAQCTSKSGASKCTVPATDGGISSANYQITMCPYSSPKSVCLNDISHYITHEHDDVMKWKHFPRYWPFVRGIHRSPVNSPHKGQWRGVLMFSFICAWINAWVNNREAGDLRRHDAHYDVIVMISRHSLASLPHEVPRSMHTVRVFCDLLYWDRYRFHLSFFMVISLMPKHIHDYQGTSEFIPRGIDTCSPRIK